MRTVFVGAQEKPNGINSYTYNLALELTNRGYDSLVISWGACNKQTDYRGTKIIQYKTYGGTMASIPLLYWKSLFYLIRHRREVDVVMFQTVKFAVLPSFILRLFGIKTYSCIHSLAEDSPKHGILTKALLVVSMYISLLLSRNVITVSHTKAQQVYSRYHKKCKVLPCGVYLPSAENIKSNVLENNGIRAGKYFLTIGRIDPIKNYEVLISAFKQHDYKDYQLVIGGDVNNDYGRKIVSLAQGCDNIIFPGLIYGDDKDVLLRHCLAYCLVSSSEGLPIALLEGMSYSKLLIVTKIPAIQEVLEKYQIGLWCDVNDVSDVTKNMKLVENSYENIRAEENVALKIVKENYTWQHICDLYLNMFK